MTDDERKNRNPAPEVGTYDLAECPELLASDLELHRVYILQGQRYAASLNYMGKVHALDPVSLDTIVCHHFHGPRVGINVYLRASPDGTLHAGTEKITLRRYSGPDQ